MSLTIQSFCSEQKMKTMMMSILILLIICVVQSFYIVQSSNHVSRNKRKTRSRDPLSDLAMSMLDFNSGWPLTTSRRQLGADVSQLMDWMDALGPVLEPMQTNNPSLPRPITTQMSVDVKESSTGYELLSDLPGIQSEDIKIDIKDRVLTISTERSLTQQVLGGSDAPTTTTTTEVKGSKTQASTKSTDEDKGNDKPTWRRVERYHGHWSRSMSLPNDADETNISADLVDGVLTVTIPKLEEVPEAVKRIPIKSSASGSASKAIPTETTASKK